MTKKVANHFAPWPMCFAGHLGKAYPQKLWTEAGLLGGLNRFSVLERRAIQTTFEPRKMAVPTTLPAGIVDTFALNEIEINLRQEFSTIGAI